jgi:tyrosyl-tRNA synthetase
MQLDDREVEEQLKFFSLRSLTEIEDLLVAHRDAPERRIAQRALADDVTTIVHGAPAARAASEAAEVLFGGDPVDASAAALDTIAGEVPTSRVAPEDLGDVIDLLVGTGLATSRSDARRLVQQRSVRANDQVVTADWSADGVELLHGRYLLLRKGRRTFHLVEVLKAAG